MNSVKDILTITPESDHSPLGGSSCERWWSCSASVILYLEHKLYKFSSGSKYAEQGTAAHVALEACVLYSQNQPYKHLIQDINFRKYYDKEMKLAIKKCVNYIFRISDEAHIYTEAKLSIPNKQYLFGSVDLHFVVGNVLHIADLKYGTGVKVSAVGNKQCFYYACLVLANLKNSDQIEFVEFHIMQPRIENGFSRKIYDIKTIKKFYMLMLSKIDNILQRKIDYVENKGCRFCMVRKFGHCQIKH